MTKYKAFILFTLLSLSLVVKSQTPSEDPSHYVLDTYDNFNSFNTSLWNRVPNNTWGLETYNPNNVTASGGVLTLKCEKIGNNYISGGIETVNKKAFSYGYFEIESQLPLKDRGYWGGFWLHSGGGTCIKGIDPGCYPTGKDTVTRTWHEMDILEPNGCDCEVGTQFHTGNHGTVSECCTNGTGTIATGLNDLSASFNKFALIWTPQSTKVLVNNNVVAEFYESQYIPSQPMFVFLTFQIDAWGCAPYSTTTFPAYWKYKNFKYYRLKTDCSNGITQSNFNFLNHDYKVQKFYSLSNSTVPNNSNIVLRATDYVQLNGEFTVPLGSTLSIITHYNTCPN